MTLLEGLETLRKRNKEKLRVLVWVRRGPTVSLETLYT